MAILYMNNRNLKIKIGIRKLMCRRELKSKKMSITINEHMESIHGNNILI